MSEYKFQQPANEDSKLVPFGKYKGQPIESMLADRNYLDWVIAQPGIVAMLQVKFPALFNIITIGAPTTDDSPDHNKLQAKFLDRGFQYAFIELLEGQSVQAVLEEQISIRNSRLLDEWQQEHKELLDKGQRCLASVLYIKKRLIEADENYAYYKETDLENEKIRLAGCLDAESLHRATGPKSVTELPIEIKLNFECGFDVGLSIRVGLYCAEWPIEIKPTLGDDFPSVLRQIKRNEATVLVIGSFQSAACSFEQVKAIFAASDKRIVMFDEIERLRNQCQRST